MNPPSALHGAMSRERKPFTYTPGGLDLSEIKSERMAKRLMRNAMNPGVPDKPVHSVQSPPMPSSPVVVPNFNCMPVQVFPSFNLPANPKSLLRTRSIPNQPQESTTPKFTPSYVNKTEPPGGNNYDRFNRPTQPHPQVNKNRPASMYEYNTMPNNPYYAVPPPNFNNEYISPTLPEISYDAQYFSGQRPVMPPLYDRCPEMQTVMAPETIKPVEMPRAIINERSAVVEIPKYEKPDTVETTKDTIPISDQISKSDKPATEQIPKEIMPAYVERSKPYTADAVEISKEVKPAFIEISKPYMPDTVDIPKDIRPSSIEIPKSETLTAVQSPQYETIKSGDIVRNNPEQQEIIATSNNEKLDTLTPNNGMFETTEIIKVDKSDIIEISKDEKLEPLVEVLQKTPLEISTDIAASIEKPANGDVGIDKQREVKVVKKTVKKEEKSSEQNGDENGDGSIEAELTVKLPTKKSSGKTETKVEVVKKVLPDGSVEEVKTTTTKTTIDGRTEIKTKTETTITPKDEEEEVEEEEEEEEEEQENGQVVVEEVQDEKEEIVEEPPQEKEQDVSSTVKENGEDDALIKNEERSETTTTTTKRVVVVESDNEPTEEVEEEQVEEEEEEVQEPEPVIVVVKKKTERLETPPLEDETEEVEEEEEVVEEKEEEKQAVELKEEVVKQDLKSEPKEPEEDEEEEKVVVKAESKPSQSQEDEEVEEEEEYEEAEEVEVKQEAKEEEAVEKKDEKVEQVPVQQVEEIKSEITLEKPSEEIKEPTEQTVKEEVVEPKPEVQEQERIIKIERPEPAPQIETKVPLREPSVPLEKVEDIEIKPISPGVITKTHTEKTEIITSTSPQPSGVLSTQTEYNRVENIVTVNRTTKTLDTTFESAPSAPDVKTYYPPSRILASPMSSRPYQPVYPPEPTTERRHSLLLERLSVDRQMPSEIYHNQTYEQQRQWSQEPQAEILTISNVKPSTITNQQWYQQRESSISNVTPTPPVAPTPTPSWTQPQPKPQPQPTYKPQPTYAPQQTYQPSPTPQIYQPSPTPQPKYQPPPTPQPQYQPPPPQPQYQPTYSDTTQHNAPSSYSTYTPKPTVWPPPKFESAPPAAPTPQPTHYISDSYQKTTQQQQQQHYSSSYIPPPWEQDSSYVTDNSQNYYQPPPASNTFTPTPTPAQSWKPPAPKNKFSKTTPTSYIPPAPNQSFVKPVSSNDVAKNLPGRKTYYSEYERRYISIPEANYVPQETKYQPQPDPSPQYYYDNNEPSETVEHQWRKELREFTEKTSQTEQTSVRPPWEVDPIYAKTPETFTQTQTPTWSQTLRPRSWRDKSFESEFVGSQEWPKTNTLGRGRPLSSYSKNESTLERTRGVSVDRYNPNNYQSPSSLEHPPVQTHTLNPNVTSTGYHNPNVPAYHSRASAEPREQPVSYKQPRAISREPRASPFQSRSFKYLQWITNTDD